MVVKTPVCSACEGQGCGLLASVIKQDMGNQRNQEETEQKEGRKLKGELDERGRM